MHLNFEDYLNLVLMQFSKLVFRFSWLLLHIIWERKFSLMLPCTIDGSIEKWSGKGRVGYVFFTVYFTIGEINIVYIYLLFFFSRHKTKKNGFFWNPAKWGYKFNFSFLQSWGELPQEMSPFLKIWVGGLKAWGELGAIQISSAT